MPWDIDIHKNNFYLIRLSKMTKQNEYNRGHIKF